MVRTIPTTIVHLAIKEKDSEVTYDIVQKFIGSEWTHTKMLKAIKASEAFPEGASIENMITTTEFTTFKLSDKAFVKAALEEMQREMPIPSDDANDVSPEQE